MSPINVDPHVYYAAGDICYKMAAGLYQAVDREITPLGECAGMAGSVGAGKEWAQSYDNTVRDTLNGVNALVEAMENYGGVLVHIGHNYAVANHNPRSGAPAPQMPAAPPPARQTCRRPPASAGGNGRGLVDDGLGLAAKIGVPIPDGDTDKLGKAAGIWNGIATADAVTAVPRELERAAAMFDAVTAPDVSHIDEDLREIKGVVHDVLQTFADLAQACREQKQALADLREALRKKLEELRNALIEELAITAAIAVASSFVTFGLGAAAGAAKAAHSVKKYVTILKGVIEAGKLAAKVKVQRAVSKAREKLQRIIDMTRKKINDFKKPKDKPSGPKVANSPETAESVTTKLDKYLLNPDHKDGGPKAKWFQQALGYTRENMGDLGKQIVFDPAKAVETGVTQYGTKYNQTIGIVGANGKVIDVQFAWIRNNDGIVRLVTAIPTPK